MTSSRRTILIFSVLWMGLALYQCVRTARICFDSNAVSTLVWVGQFGLLAMPIVALGRRSRMLPERDSDVDGALMLMLLSYVPVTLALHTAETCTRH